MFCFNTSPFLATFSGSTAPNYPSSPISGPQIYRFQLLVKKNGPPPKMWVFPLVPFQATPKKTRYPQKIGVPQETNPTPATIERWNCCLLFPQLSPGLGPELFEARAERFGFEGVACFFFLFFWCPPFYRFLEPAKVALVSMELTGHFISF